MNNPLSQKGRLSFVIPFISKQLASNWEFQNQLLRRTLESVLNQAHRDFYVVLVGHDKPLFPLTHSRIRWVQVGFALSVSDRDPPETSSPDLEVKWTDRGRKLYKGVNYSTILGATHVLPVDSDDLVSQRLATLPAENPTDSGWLIWSGYRYFEGSHFVRYKPQRFFEECGTGAILKIADMPFPDSPEYDRGYAYYGLLVNHAYIAANMEQAGHPLKRLPFPGAVYVIHGHNFYAKRRRSRFPGWAWDECKNLVMRRRINDHLRREFAGFSLKEQILESSCRVLTGG